MNGKGMLRSMNKDVTGCGGDLGLRRPHVAGAGAAERDVPQAEGRCPMQNAPQDLATAPRVRERV